MKSRRVQPVVALAVLFVALMAGCSSSGEKTEKASGPFARLDPAAFAERMNAADAEVINVHIPYEGELDQTDAFIRYDKILDDANLPKDKNAEILLYCRSGRMSEEAGAVLNEHGYTNVAHLEGGMKAWEAAGRKLIQNPAHAESTPTPTPTMQHG